MTNNYGSYIPKAEPRRERDVYETPIDIIPKLLGVLPDLAGCRILDFGAGDGRWGKAIKKMYNAVHITGAEIRDIPKPDEYDAWINGDVMDVEGQWDWVIGNPPYKGLNDTLEKAFTLAPKVSFLLLLSFLESVERYEKFFGNGYAPSVYTCVRRVKFAGKDGKAKGYLAFGQFVWGVDEKPMLGWII